MGPSLVGEPPFPGFLSPLSIGLVGGTAGPQNTQCAGPKTKVGRFGSFALSIGSLALSVAALYQLFLHVDPLPGAIQAIADPAQTEQAVALYTRALSQDPASAYRWADLGEAQNNLGHFELARICYTRAIELAPAVPAIRLRYIGFLLMRDDHSGLLENAAIVLRTVPDYDGVLFRYMDAAIPEPQRIVAAIGDQRRTMRSWLSYMIGSNNPTGAEVAWKRVSAAGFGDDALAGSYVEYLLKLRSWNEAVSTWAKWVGTRAGDFPNHNLIFNANFAADPAPCVLDWRITQEPDVHETGRDGQAIRVRFLGKANVNYQGVSQIAILPAPGRYRLSARFKTDNITTNEGVRLCLPDLGLCSESLTGTRDWAPVNLEFQTKDSRLVLVSVRRNPSQKFDNKVQGTAWATAFMLAHL